MKKVSGRAIFPLILAIVLLAGTVLLCVRYFAKADEWVTFSGSPHVYTGVNLDGGVVTDRDGTLLLDSTDGRTYSADAVTRTATMHLLGDRYGYIQAPLLGSFADDMIGFDKINGLYGAEGTEANAALTLSAAAQTAAYQALGNYHGTVGVYNYKTGEILCAVTSPSYDPDNMPDVDADTSGAYDGVYVNRFFQAAYTPGSIFKIVTLAAAIETVPDWESLTFTCEGKTIIGVADPAIWDASRGESVADTAARYGVFFTPGDNERIAGWMQCHYRLQFDEDGYPRMYVFNTCRAFIRTIPTLIYDEHRAEDLDTKMEDHVADEWRYFCMSRPIKPIRAVKEQRILFDPLDMMKRR